MINIKENNDKMSQNARAAAIGTTPALIAGANNDRYAESFSPAVSSQSSVFANNLANSIFNQIKGNAAGGNAALSGSGTGALPGAGGQNTLPGASSASAPSAESYNMAMRLGPYSENKMTGAIDYVSPVVKDRGAGLLGDDFKALKDKYAAAGNGSVTNSDANPAGPSADSVRVRDYFAAFPDADVTWDESLGKAYVNGFEIPVTYISEDGRSYAKKSDLDEIYRMSVANNQNSFESFKNGIIARQDELERQARALGDVKDFEYDFTKDPMFKIYSDYYDRMGEEAFNDALVSGTSGTGGYMNSNALAAAYLARERWNSQKMNVVPTLAAQAYERYAGDRNSRLEEFNSLKDTIINNNANLITMRSNEFDRNAQVDDMKADNALQRDQFNADEVYRWADFNEQRNLAWAQFRASDYWNEASQRLDEKALELQARGLEIESEQFQEEMRLERDKLMLEYGFSGSSGSGSSGSGSKKSSGTSGGGSDTLIPYVG